MAPGLMPCSPRHPPTHSVDGADRSSGLVLAFGALWDLLGWGGFRPCRGWSQPCRCPWEGTGHSRDRGCSSAAACGAMSPSGLHLGSQDPSQIVAQVFLAAFSPFSGLEKSWLSPACPPPSCLHAGRVLQHKAGQALPPWRGHRADPGGSEMLNTRPPGAGSVLGGVSLANRGEKGWHDSPHPWGSQPGDLLGGGAALQDGNGSGGV